MYQLFRGYVTTKNKKCTMPFKGKSSEELLNLREASQHDEFAGILNDNTVLIDVDDYDQSEILMRIVEDKQLACRVYETTRGKHFLFKNNDRAEKNWTKKTLACGLQSDCKLGSHTSYSVLKYGGKDRPIIYDIFTDEDYDPVPKWLLPVKGKADFISMDEGDGRNQSLFNYILTLQSAGFSKDEARECIHIINKYVLEKPLDDRELASVLRDDAFKKPVFYDGKTFLHDAFGRFLISEYNIIKIGGVLHYFKDGVYVPVNIEGLMIKHIPNLKQQQRKEVLSYMMAYIDQNTAVSSANFIAFKNGIYDVSNGTLEAFSKDKIMTNKIHWNYNPNAYSELVDSVLNSLACNERKVRLLLEEVIGYTFYRRNELRKAFMLKGKRHNGKSTFLDMLGYLLGEDNISALDLADLSHEYKAAGLFGKLANLGDDIEDEFIPSAGLFKKIVSGDRMNANVKFAAPIEFNPYCKLIFSGNTIPRLGRGRDSDAIIDRLIIVPFNASFNKNTEGFSPFIKYQLRTKECMEYLVRIGVEGLKRVLATNSFTVTDDMNRELEEYAEALNPITTFFAEVGDTMENEPTKKCYRLYDQYCFENAMKPISHVEFSRQVKEFFGYDIKTVRFQGKPTKIYVRKDDDGADLDEGHKR
ncbi:phage/plasmid primase, P4 family [Anaerotignum sp.]